jgi:uncharacterized protein (TIGR02246 family)
MRKAGARLVMVVVAAVVGVTGLSWAAHHEAGGSERLAKEFETAWVAGDAEALGTLYTEGALRVDAFGQVQQGREAIVAALAEGLNGPFAGTSIAITVGKSQDLGGDTRTFEGTYRISGVTGPDGGTAPDFEGVYLNTVQKVGDDWRIAASAAFSPRTDAAED